MKRSRGFTIIELLFTAIVLGIASIVFFVQKNNIEIVARDDKKKTAINAMYYSLEEVFYPQSKFYPQSIDEKNVKSMDPTIFTDPDGKKINTEGSAYSYTPTDCTNEKCKSYTLKASLENEDDYTKKSKN